MKRLYEGLEINKHELIHWRERESKTEKEKKKKKKDMAVMSLRNKEKRDLAAWSQNIKNQKMKEEIRNLCD